MSGKDEFDAEMQEYLDRRPRENYENNHRTEESVTNHADAAREESDNQQNARLQDDDANQDVREDEADSQPVSKKESAIGRLWQDLFGSDEQEEPVPETQLLDDFKTIAKISLDVMKRLSDDERAQLKESTEFAQFKNILKKYNVIK